MWRSTVRAAYGQEATKRAVSCGRAHEAPLSMLAHGVDVGLGDIEEVGAHAVLPLGA